ncbi:MAG: hypothetical protein AMXMBFR58_30720 [Phycisphaerae bacterium]|nr:hypothetical protein [Phycisphaerales bacterium]
MTGVWTPPPLVRRPAHLVAVNAVLALVLAAVFLATAAGPTARAQSRSDAPARPRGHYTMLSPKSGVGETGSLVIVDSINEEMTTLDWDKSRRALVVRGYSDLTADSTEVIGR